MFELLAGLIVFGIAAAVLVGAFTIVAGVLKLTFKLLLAPLALVGVIVAGAVIFAVGTALLATAIAVIVPLVVIGLIVAAPFALIAALT
jgi:hypothetical protein